MQLINQYSLKGEEVRWWTHMLSCKSTKNWQVKPNSHSLEEGPEQTSDLSECVKDFPPQSSFPITSYILTLQTDWGQTIIWDRMLSMNINLLWRAELNMFFVFAFYFSWLRLHLPRNKAAWNFRRDIFVLMVSLDPKVLWSFDKALVKIRGHISHKGFESLENRSLLTWLFLFLLSKNKQTHTDTQMHIFGGLSSLWSSAGETDIAMGKDTNTRPANGDGQEVPLCACVC